MTREDTERLERFLKGYGLADIYVRGDGLKCQNSAIESLNAKKEYLKLLFSAINRADFKKS
jgi:hypothetical protein